MVLWNLRFPLKTKKTAPVLVFWTPPWPNATQEFQSSLLGYEEEICWYQTPKESSEAFLKTHTIGYFLWHGGKVHGLQGNTHIRVKIAALLLIGCMTQPCHFTSPAERRPEQASCVGGVKRMLCPLPRTRWVPALAPWVTDYNPENPRSECIHFLPSMLYYTEGIYFSWVSHSFVEVPSSSWKSIFSASYWESEKWYKSEWMRIPPTKVIYFKSVMMQVGFLSFVSPYFRTIGGGRESTLVGDPLGSEWLLSLYCGKIRVRVQLTI